MFKCLDRRLISFLREVGRVPVAKRAVTPVAMSATARARIDRRKASDAILGVTVRTRKDHVPDGVPAIMMIEVPGQFMTGVIRRLRGLPELRQCPSIHGNRDLVVRVSARIRKGIDRVQRGVRCLDSMSRIEISLLLCSA